MQKLYFIRHGLSEMNLQGLFAGSTDTPLSEKGREQARLAGQNAKDLDIDYIVCSPLSRAHETAKLFAKEIGYPVKDIHINNLLTERHYGELEGKPWAPDLDLDGIIDIETVDTLLERAKLALDWIHTLPAQHILIVSHGTFGRAIRSLIDKDKPFHTRTTKEKDRMKNAEIHQWI